MRLALIVEYEGTNYHGFQYQANAPSIQEELENAIARFTGENVRVKAAGRTDAGVHARGQVVVFDTVSGNETDVFARALNAHLPEDIAVNAAHRVSEGFDPRRQALTRRYRYTIINSRNRSPLMRRTAFLVKQPLNVRKMKEAAGSLVGTHDFGRFAATLDDESKSTVRQIFEASVKRIGELVTFEVEGNSFLPHQVRRMAGSLVDIGRGTMTLEEFRRIVDGGSGEPRAHSLPAQGLCLIEVTYADFPPEAREQDVREY